MFKEVRATQVAFDAETIAECSFLVSQSLIKGQLVRGSFYEAFTRRIKSLTGRDFCALTNSDTLAQEILFRILDVEGKKVVFQGNIFPSPVFAAIRAGATPIFADIDLDGLSVTEESLQKVLRPDVVAVVIMDTGGILSDHLFNVERWLKEEKIVLIEDAAHSLGSRTCGRFAGSFGDFGILSFYPTKVLTTGMGGAVVCNEQAIKESMDKWTQYGRSELYGSTFDVQGYSGMLSDVNLAIGVGMLNSFSKMLERRKSIAKVYNQAISHPEVDTYQPNSASSWNYYRYIVFVNSPKFDRVQYGNLLKEKYNIELTSAVYEVPCYRQPALAKLYGVVELPNVEVFCKQHFCLPLHPLLNEEDIDRVVEVVQKTLPKAIEGIYS